MKAHVIAAVAAGALALGGTVGATTFAPRLRLVDREPVVVRGEHFKAHEKVTVTLSAKGRWTRVVQATATGAFTARFAAATVDTSCPVYFVRATGSKGSAAILRSSPQIDCAQPGPNP